MAILMEGTVLPNRALKEIRSFTNDLPSTGGIDADWGPCLFTENDWRISTLSTLSEAILPLKVGEKSLTSADLSLAAKAFEKGPKPSLIRILHWCSISQIRMRSASGRINSFLIFAGGAVAKPPAPNWARASSASWTKGHSAWLAVVWIKVVIVWLLFPAIPKARMAEFLISLVGPSSKN